MNKDLNRKRKVCFFSGSRADYGRLSPVWRKVQEVSELDMILCVSGTHLSSDLGFSRSLFEKDGFTVDYEIPILLESGLETTIPKSIGLGLIAMNDILNKERPDFVFVFGDRSEMLIPAIAAVHMNIPVIHMGGGFATFGVIDEVVRHSLTKISHIHLVTSKKCYERVLRMGEEPERIFFVGSPAIDYIKNMNYISKKELFHNYNLDLERPFIIVTFHPVTTEYDQMSFQIDEFFNALNSIDAQIMITYPNLDLGGSIIIKKLKELKNLIVVKDLSMKVYLSFLKYADMMIGNSSSGFIEAPYFSLPVINVGNRQLGREREVNIIDVEIDKSKIIDAIKKHLKNTVFRDKISSKFKNTYGNGKSAEKTMEILKTISIDNKLLQKRITY